MVGWTNAFPLGQKQTRSYDVYALANLVSVTLRQLVWNKKSVSKWRGGESSPLPPLSKKSFYRAFLCQTWNFATFCLKI